MPPEMRNRAAVDAASVPDFVDAGSLDDPDHNSNGGIFQPGSPTPTVPAPALPPDLNPAKYPLIAAHFFGVPAVIVEAAE